MKILRIKGAWIFALAIILAGFVAAEPGWAASNRVVPCDGFMVRDYDLNKDGDMTLDACDNKNYSGGVDVVYANPDGNPNSTRCFLKVEDGNFDPQDGNYDIRVVLYAYTGEFMGEITRITPQKDGGGYYGTYGLWAQSVKLNPVTNEIWFSYTASPAYDFFYKCAWDPANPFGKTATQAVRMDCNWEVEFDSNGTPFFAGKNSSDWNAPQGVYQDANGDGVLNDLTERLISIPDCYSAGFAIDSDDNFYVGTYYSAGAGDEVKVYDSSGTTHLGDIPMPQTGDPVCGQELASNQGCNDVDCDPADNVYVSTNGYGGVWPDVVEEGTVSKIAAGTWVIEKYLGYKIDDLNDWDWFRGIAYDGESNIEAGGYTDPTQPSPTGNRLYLDMDFTQLASGGNGPDTIVGFAAECDADGDEVPDSLDNAPETANDNQVDADLDGYGNICDADFDNNGIVRIDDFNMMKSVWGGSDNVIDMDSDGVIGIGDFNLLNGRWGDSAPYY